MKAHKMMDGFDCLGFSLVVQENNRVLLYIFMVDIAREKLVFGVAE